MKDRVKFKILGRKQELEVGRAPQHVFKNAFKGMVTIVNSTSQKKRKAYFSVRFLTENSKLRTRQLDKNLSR